MKIWNITNLVKICNIPVQTEREVEDAMDKLQSCLSEELERKVKGDVYFNLLFCIPTDANTNFGPDIQTNSEYLHKMVDKLSNQARVGGDKVTALISVRPICDSQQREVWC